MAAAGSPEPVAIKAEKKHKKDKSEKKRSREEDGGENTERKHKKSKSIVNADDVQVDDDEEISKKKKKDKKEKKSKDKSEEKEERKKKKSKKSREGEDKDDEPNDTDAIQDQLEQSAEPMDVDQPSSSSDAYQPADIPSNPQFPFYSQTVSLYEPIYPVGWAEPVTNAEYQHLKHLQNRYVPSLRGVLMDYRNVSLGDEAGRVGAATTDEAETKLKSQGEYGVGFGWVTADVDLFVPSRGAWMEGSVNLQTEGHIGVVCFGKFNASIEARRLPTSWKWISNEDSEAEGMEETASVIAPDEHGVVRQIHSTGFWVDGQGEKVKGKIRFRIRNFDVGMSGETTYLSLEGTMLAKAAEKALVKEEAETARMRKNKKGGRRFERRRAPEFSMTRFETEEDKRTVEDTVGAAEASNMATEEGTKIVFDE